MARLLGVPRRALRPVPYLKGQTWLYRRNYPTEVAAVLGRRALKRSLKTSDVKTAKVRAAEVNAQYEATVQQVLEGAGCRSHDPDH
jgi:hypothetical protein